MKIQPVINTDLSPVEIETIAKAVGELAERVALDCDHRNLNHKAWYRAVQKARRILGIKTTNPHLS